LLFRVRCELTSIVFTLDAASDFPLSGLQQHGLALRRCALDLFARLHSGDLFVRNLRAHERVFRFEFNVGQLASRSSKTIGRIERLARVCDIGCCDAGPRRCFHLRDNVASCFKRLDALGRNAASTENAQHCKAYA
jgi:hypothetical protein